MNEDNRYVLVAFTGKISGQVKLNSEIDQVRWIGKSEVRNFDFCGNCLKKLIDYYNT
jgi:hypothetical protein